MGVPPSNTNVRVTNARLGEKIDGLTTSFKEFREEVRGARKDHEERLRKVETEQVRLEEKGKMWGRVIGTVAVVGTAISSMLGLQD